MPRQNSPSRLPEFLSVAVPLLLAARVFVAGNANAVELARVKEFLINNWDQGDGLPSSRINSIAHTPDGYLWLATHGGLARFDGVRFTTFGTNAIPSMQSNAVSCVLTDHEGVLWIGTTVGTLIRRDAQGFLPVKLPGAQQYAGRWVNSLAESAEGALWIAIDEAGLVRFKGGHSECYQLTNGLPATNVTELLRAKNGDLWAVGDGHLLRYLDQRWQIWDGENPPSEEVRVICQAGGGGLWVATYAEGFRGTRIYRFQDDTWQEESGPYPWAQGSVRSRSHAIFEDGEGKLWCATAGGGIFFRQSGGPWQRLVSAGSLSQSDTLCFMQDDAGILWVGTRTAGLYQVRPRLVRTLPLPSEDNQHVVLTVCAADDGSLWAGTDGAGLYRWHDSELSQYGVAQGLGNLHVNTLLEDSRSNLWAGTVGGLYRLNRDRFEPVEGSTALRTSVMALYEDPEGTLWAASRGGLIRFRGDEIRLFTSRDGLGGAPGRALATDREGRLWVEIETAGMYRQKGGQFERVEGLPPGLATGARAIIGDSSGALWFATRSSGLFRWQDNQLNYWNYESDGLPSDRHFGLMDDSNGNLWVSSENGIFGCPKRALEKYQRGHTSPLTPWRLTQADGLAYKVCTGGGQPAAARSADGLLWFGDGPAVAVFDPAAVPHGIHVWQPLVEEAIADGEELPRVGPWEVRVKSGAASFEFRYTSPNVIAPQRLRFRYQLLGADKHWVQADHRRAAYYTHLSPGHYRFLVQAAAPDGDWVESARALSVVVVPRFFERRTVQAAGSLLLLAAVAGTVWRAERNRSRRRMERLKLQSAMEEERQRIARDIHDDLGSGLTEIILLSDNLKDEMPVSQSAEKMVSEISTRARALTHAMDEVVWAVNPRNDTLESLLTYFNKFAQEYLTSASIRCRLDVPVDLPPVPLSAESRHHLYLACKEALNNVVKHSGASEVWIRSASASDRFSLSIEDNGRGFDAGAQSSRGHGLQNMRRRLEELGGRCEITSKPGAGVRVTFSLSIRQLLPRDGHSLKS